MRYNFKNILIAVDPSENAMRAVKYTAIMLKNTPDCSVTLLNIIRNPLRDHFASKDQWEKACEDTVRKGREALEKARDVLIDSGIDSSAISIKVVEAKKSSIASEIMKVQEEGGFGTVAVGRRGVTKEEEFLFGSVSNKVVHYARNCTVWVVE